MCTFWFICKKNSCLLTMEVKWGNSFFSIWILCCHHCRKLIRRMSEFKLLQRCPWFNSPNLVNMRAQGWPRLGWSWEIVYNSKKPTETCTVLPVKMLHQCCIIPPQMLTALSSEKKPTEMILAGKICWAQKMPWIYPAARVWDGSGLKAENMQVQELLSDSTANVSDNLSWHFRHVSPLWWKMVHSVQSVNGFVDTKSKLRNKICEYTIAAFHFLLLYSQTVQLSCKSNLFLLILRTAFFMRLKTWNITL